MGPSPRTVSALGFEYCRRFSNPFYPWSGRGCAIPSCLAGEHRFSHLRFPGCGARSDSRCCDLHALALFQVLRRAPQRGPCLRSAVCVSCLCSRSRGRSGCLEGSPPPFGCSRAGRLLGHGTVSSRAAHRPERQGGTNVLQLAVRDEAILVGSDGVWVRIDDLGRAQLGSRYSTGAVRHLAERRSQCPGGVATNRPGARLLPTRDRARVGLPQVLRTGAGGE